MGKTLIITEKPSVAREYAKVLNVTQKGDGYLYSDKYVIAWCVGHLVTMSYPEVYDAKYKKWEINDLPFIPDEYKYEVIKDVKKQYDVLKGFMNSAEIDTILYGGDSGREGEYIGRLVRKKSGIRKGIVEKRIWIDSFTEDEIIRGIREAKPLSEYDSLYWAAEERAIEDYSTGLNFSRAFSCKYGYKFNKAVNAAKWMPIAVGRVMTCVLGMVVKREHEIRDFKVTPFYKIAAKSASPDITLDWHVTDTSEYHNSPKLYNDKGFKEESEAERLLSVMAPELTISSNTKSKENKKAPLLFNLAELQGTCTKLFKISPDQTLEIAQSLYEKKLTTYPRTDARVLSTAVAKEIDKTVGKLKGYGGEIADYCNEIMTNGTYNGIEKTQYTDDSKISDHYCIIPTGETGAMKDLTDIESKVYELIVRRFLSIFYPPAVYTKYILEAASVHGSYSSMFSTSEKLLTEPGFLKVAGKITVKDDEDDEKEESDKERKAKILESLTKGSTVHVRFEIVKGETTPPKRYTSGSMVLAMENAGNLIEDEDLRAQIKGSGIGTSATRADIIAKLVSRGYILLNKKTQILTPAISGECIYSIVNAVIPELLSPEITANWEKGLEDVRAKTITKEYYENKVHDYVRKGVDIIKNAPTDFPFLAAGAGNAPGTPGAKEADSLGKCPLCDGYIHTVSFGYGCSNYKSDKTGCNFVIGKKLLEREIKPAEIKQILSKRKTAKKLDGFVSKKTGNSFSAFLVLNEDNTVSFSFN